MTRRDWFDCCATVAHVPISLVSCEDDRKVVHEILNELVEVEELAKRAVDEP